MRVSKYEFQLGDVLMSMKALHVLNNEWINMHANGSSGFNETKKIHTWINKGVGNSCKCTQHRSLIAVFNGKRL